VSPRLPVVCAVASAVEGTFMSCIREKKHRLPIESYKGTVAAAFTVCTKNWVLAFEGTSGVMLAEGFL